MSFFAFKRDENDKILVNDQAVAEFLERLLNELILLNMRVEEAFETKIDAQDIEE